MDRILVGTTTKADRLLVAGLVDLQPVFNALQGSVLIVGGLMTRLWLHARRSVSPHAQPPMSIWVSIESGCS